MIIPKWLKFIVVGFLPLYFLYLVAAKTPATWAAWAAQKALPGLWLSGISGSFWQGNAEFGQLDLGDTMLIALGDVRWEISPWSLLTLRVCSQLQTSATGQTVTGKFCHSITGNTAVKNLDVDLPVGIVNALLPVQVDGQGSLQVMSAKFDNDLHVKALDAKLSWRDARAHNGDTWLSLGSFGATLQESEQGGITAAVVDLEGPFKVNADAAWILNDGWRVTATVTPQSDAPDMLVQGLQVIGEEKTKGTYSLAWP